MGRDPGQDQLCGLSHMQAGLSAALERLTTRSHLLWVCCNCGWHALALTRASPVKHIGMGMM